MGTVILAVGKRMWLTNIFILLNYRQKKNANANKSLKQKLSQINRKIMVANKIMQM